MNTTNKTQNPEPAVFLVNNATFTSPDVPILLQILSGKSKPSDLLPKGTVYGLEARKTVEISIPAGALGGPVSRSSCENC
jgi:iron transport multicopper oxidase